ncbi:MAG: PAS domain-containing sensor histidine kinase, partial [Akkermansiaceae bacterium]|nr:PAS domain-containing sensor histidine kinase [Akkermansiaceae bacterium]
MQVAIGVLQDDELAGRPRRYVDAVNEELQHMSHLVRELLNFSRINHQKSQTLVSVPLAPLLQ